MREASRSRNRGTPHPVKYTLPALLLAVALGATAALGASDTSSILVSPIDYSLDAAQSRSLGYAVPGEAVQIAPSVAPVLPTEHRPLADGLRDYDASQCTHYAAHFIYDTYDNTAFFFRRQSDPRNARDFPRHHEALGGKSGSVPTVHSVLVTYEGRTGHVAVVTAVHQDGSFTVSEKNFLGRGVISERTLLGDDPVIRTFLYIDEVAPAAPVVEPVAPSASIDGDPVKEQLRTYLTEKGSPYAEVDVIAHCDASGITRNQCALLLAICGKESQHGTAYKNTKGRPKEEGYEFHNCAGVKGGASWHDFPYSGGKDGWWIAKFPDWDTFWQTFIAGQKKARFDKGRTTPRAFANSCYVGGCGSNGDWIASVGKIQKALAFLET